MRGPIAILDIAFLLGFSANALKAGDLLLRRHQKEALGRAVEELTLRLDCLRPLRWFRRAQEDTEKELLLNLGGLAFGIAAFGIVFFNFARGYQAVSELNDLRQANGALHLTTYLEWPKALPKLPNGPKVFFSPIGSFLTTTLARPVGKWILHGLRFRLVALRFCTAGIASLLLEELGRRWALQAEGDLPSELWGVCVLTLFAVLMPGFVSVVFGVVLWAANGVVRICSGISWRVVEYSKGPVAGLFALLTVVVGVADLLLRELGKGH